MLVSISLQCVLKIWKQCCSSWQWSAFWWFPISWSTRLTSMWSLESQLRGTLEKLYRRTLFKISRKLCQGIDNFPTKYFSSTDSSWLRRQNDLKSRIRETCKKYKQIKAGNHLTWVNSVLRLTCKKQNYDKRFHKSNFTRSQKSCIATITRYRSKGCDSDS